jgi:hypothetical protein
MSTVKGEKVTTVVRLNAGHTTNGNARRWFLLMGGEHGVVLGMVEEGLLGPSAMKDCTDDGDVPTAMVLDVKVSYKEAKELKEHSIRAGTYFHGRTSV